MNGKTVEMRLVIFRARINYTISQIYYDVLGVFPITGRRVDTHQITPPPPPPASYRGEAMKNQPLRDRGGRPRLGVGAGESGAFPRCGLRRSTETAVGEPPTSTTKYLSPGTLTR